MLRPRQRSVARLQNTPTRGDDPSTATVAFDPSGEIAVRRRDADAGGAQAAERSSSAGATRTLSREQARGDAGTPAETSATLVEVGEFRRIEDYLRAYLEHERFRSPHPLACGRWVVAWEMLWCADSHAKVLAIGERARAAMQAFAESMFERCAPLAIGPDWPQVLVGAAEPQQPGNSLLTVLECYRGALGEERWGFLRTLHEDWRALLERVERHGAEQRERGERLRWEDGRRLVLFTALVMVEVDRSFS
jgi:hypothetical protein